jgi:hypothetical protein
LKTLGTSRLLSVALVLSISLHFCFLWVLQGLHLPAARVQVPLTFLAPTVLVLLPPLAGQSSTPPLPEQKHPLESARARNSVLQANAPPSIGETDPVVTTLTPPARLSPAENGNTSADPAVTKPTSSASPATQIAPASPASIALSAPSQAALNEVPIASAAPAAPAAPEPPKPLNLSLSREAIRALPPASAPLLASTRLPLTAEQRMSKTLAASGNGSWVEERLDMTHVRYRKGDLCITYTRQETAAVLPFVEYAQRLPWVSSGVQACPH